MIEIELRQGPVRYHAFDPFPQPAGAECVFLGRTRIESHAEHGRLMRLSYEAYEPMARTVLHELAEVAVERFGCLAVRIHHALGAVPAGEASVLVQTVCGHREDSFDACRYLIDALKSRAPIWKREDWADGTSWAAGKSPEISELVCPGRTMPAAPVATTLPTAGENAKGESV